MFDLFKNSRKEQNNRTVFAVDNAVCLALPGVTQSKGVSGMRVASAVAQELSVSGAITSLDQLKRE